MKTPLLFLGALFFATALFATEPPRQTIIFNREWKFQLGDHAGAEAAAFDDA